MNEKKSGSNQVPGKILRFTKGERLSHWVHAVSFFVLLLTGWGILSEFSRPVLMIFGGVDVSRILHRVFAVIFVVVVVAMFFIKDPKYHWEWLRSAFRFTKADIAHIMAFPKEFFGGHGNYPAQGKFNGGEKINSLITILGSVFITLSGFIMWSPHVFPDQLVRIAYPVHDMSMFMMVAALMGHLYLSLLHPESRAALPGMLKGYVSEKFAKAHHAAWYKEVKDQEK
ncbi:MAG: formate dehydrogenase subunit gamma [Dehalobacter sp. 4CP]|uniref:formate dehydrogenase subunit gamma n=1 Tax=Dehalobacter sp. CP TaxID=2594474 RepID=UPI0013CC5CED|nr:formate dehydrogenase subunit gamma [Dehalobacter sp.]NBJ16312.1 formate dehydrogenase subunit gamma [Dehalobacter sp. 4CP]